MRPPLTPSPLVSRNPTPTPNSLPDSAFVNGVTGQSQSRPLSCESRSAVDLAAFWGVNISESEFLTGLPRSDNPTRERLAFRFESGNDALGVHAQLDHLDRNLAPNGLALLSPINDAEAPLADLLQKFIAAYGITDLLLLEGELSSCFHGAPQRFRAPLY